MINSNYLDLGRVPLDPPSTTDFDSVPILSHCDIQFARANAGEYGNKIIDAILNLNEFDVNTLKISFVVQRLTPGSFSIRPGWHSDWHCPDGIPSCHNKRRVGIMYIGDQSRTDFYVGPIHNVVVTGDPTMSPEEYWNFRDALVEEYINRYPEATIHSSKPNNLYIMTPNTIHRPTAAVGDCRRILVKLEDSDRAANNRILRTTNAYIPHSSMQHSQNLDKFLL